MLKKSVFTPGFVKRPTKHQFCLLLVVLLAGCSYNKASRSYQMQASPLVGQKEATVDNQLAGQADQQQKVTAMLTHVPPMQDARRGFVQDKSIADRFSTAVSLSIAAEAMPLLDFLHYSFGELLNANYILGDSLAGMESPVTLNIQEKISPQKLFILTEQLLLERGIGISRQNDVLYIAKVTKDSNANVAIGYGRTAESVPNGLNVQQIVPLRFLLNSNAIRSLRDIANVKATFDVGQGVLFLSGERQQVLRALELMEILDAPGSRSRNIGLLKLTYLSAENFITSIREILANEGITGAENNPDSRVSFVPLSQLGAVAVFATEAEFVSRIEFWAGQLDKPSKGKEQQYFIYTPRFARASDLGESVAALITGKSTGRQSSAGPSAQAANESEQRSAQIEQRDAKTSTGVNTEEMRMVVDDRSNSLIFYSTGTEYQALLPMVERLDVMPKQVLLELSIAEVNLTDEFELGVDAAFSSGKFGLTNSAAASRFSTALTWVSGANNFDLQAFESNRLVNILSKPSLLVRDGVAANINVGTDLPIVGKTTTDPTNGTTRSVEYRKTGIEVTVTPTINAQGVVIMTIEQNTSNQVDGGAELEGNPQIFERSLSTEVVAESGQTIVLGGLISENNSDNKTGLPGLHNVPVLGLLFGSVSNSNTRTELVIMVTPRVIQRTDEWEEIKNKLNQGYELINLK